jgi:hypothetical protein
VYEVEPRSWDALTVAAGFRAALGIVPPKHFGWPIGYSLKGGSDALNY